MDLVMTQSPWLHQEVDLGKVANDTVVAGIKGSEQDVVSVKDPPTFS